MRQSLYSTELTTSICSNCIIPHTSDEICMAFENKIRQNGDESVYIKKWKKSLPLAFLVFSVNSGNVWHEEGVIAFQVTRHYLSIVFRTGILSSLTLFFLGIHNIVYDNTE